MECCNHRKPPAEGNLPDQSDCCGSVSSHSLPSDIWLRLGISLVVAGQNMVWGLAFNLSRPETYSREYLIGHGWMILSTLLVVALLGPCLAENALGMFRLRRLTVEGLFMVTAAGAFVASLLTTITGEGSVYYEVVSVVLVIYTVGAFVGDQARGKTRLAVREFEEQYDTAVRLESCGEENPVPVGELNRGDRVVISPGKPIPVDGEIQTGRAYVREAALTGEPHPRSVRQGDGVRAGSWSLDGRLVVRVDGDPGNREIDRIIGILNEARESPSRLQRHADRITQWFLPLVVTVSFITFAGWAVFVPWPEALFNSMAVLLVACPCALGLATPIAIWSGLWRLFQVGIISRSAALLDVMAETRRLFFDKTGTLSESEIQVTGFQFAEGMEEKMDMESIRSLVCAMERGQNHPLARALFLWNDKAGAKGITHHQPQTVRLVPGLGLEGLLLTPTIDGRAEEIHVRIGEPSWLSSPQPATENRRWVALEVDGKVIGNFELREVLRGHLSGVFGPLHEAGIDCEILTGDAHPAWESISGVTVTAGCSPEDKMRRVETSRRNGENPLFIGDGINDTAAMQKASASLAIAGGAELTQTVGTGIIQGGSLRGLPAGVAIARSIRKTLRENLLFAACYNFAGMGLAASGYLHPVAAALLMVVSSVMVSVRAAHSAKKVPLREEGAIEEGSKNRIFPRKSIAGEGSHETLYEACASSGVDKSGASN